MDGNKLLLLGDYHLSQIHDLKKDTPAELLFGNAEGDTVWHADSKHTNKDLKKIYNSYILESGVPDIVVISVGGNDLTRFSNANCLISSILRFVKTLCGNGVKSVIICSLVNRNIPPPYNTNVKKVNNVLQAKAKKMNGVYFLHYIRKPELNASDFIDDKLLTSELYSIFYRNLLKILTNKVVKYIQSLKLTNMEQKKKTINEDTGDHLDQINELEMEKQISDIQDYISKHKKKNIKNQKRK